MNTVTVAGKLDYSIMIAKSPHLTVVFFLVTFIPAQVAPANDPMSPELQKKILMATVRIVKRDSPTHSSIGTGVVIAQDTKQEVAYVLSAWHVWAAPGKASLQAFSLSDYPLPTQVVKNKSVTLVAKDTKADLVLLQVKTAKPLQGSLHIALDPTIESPPFPAISAGCAMGRPEPTLWTTVVNSVRTIAVDDVDARFWITDERCPHGGESGGPLANRFGGLIGICTASVNEEQGAYVHVSEIREFVGRSLPEAVQSHDLQTSRDPTATKKPPP